MRYTKSALGLLNAQYRSVLKKCLLINLGLFALAAISATPAHAASEAEIVVKINGSSDITYGTVKEGTTNGTINIKADAIGVDADIPVHGLGSAAYANTSAFDASGAAAAVQGATTETVKSVDDKVTALDGRVTTAEDKITTLNGAENVTGSVKNTAKGYADTAETNAKTYADGVGSAIEGKLDDGAAGYDINAKTLKVQGVDVATVSDTQTLTNKTIDASSNTISNLGTTNFASGTVVSTAIDAGAGASDKLASTAALGATRTAINSDIATALATANTNIDNAITYDSTSGLITFKNSDGTTVDSTAYSKDKADLTFAGLAASNTFSNSNTFNGGVTMTQGLSITGGTLSTTGNATVGGTLGVTGALTGSTATFSGKVTSVGLDAGAGAIQTTGTLAAGASTLNSLDVTNGATVGGTLDVTGDTTLSGKLNGTTGTFTGLVTTNGLNAGSGAITTTGALSAGAATVTSLDAGSGTIKTTGALQGGSLAVTGDATVGGDLTVTGDLSADDATVKTLKIGSSAVIDSVDDGSSALTGGNATTLASTATVLKSAENATYTGTKVKGDTSSTTIKAAVDKTVQTLNNVLTADGTEVDSAKVDVQWGGVDSTLKTALGAGFAADGNEIEAHDSVTTALSSLDTAIGDRTITSANTAINTALATDISTAVEKIGDEIGTQTYSNTAGVNYNAIAANTNLTTAVSQVSSNIGAPIASVQNRTKGKIATTNTVNANIAALDAAIGADVTKTYNNVATANSINENLDAINATIGNMDVDLHKTYTPNGSTGNALTNGGTSTPTTVVAALNNIDATLGTIHGLQAKIQTTNPDAGTNLASNSTVEEHLTQLDSAIGNRTNLGSKNAAINTASQTSVAAGLKATGDAIGDMDFSSTRYVSGSEDLTTAVRSLDSNIYRIDKEVSDLKHDFKSGMASMAAMTALVPNARSCGDTSLSLGTGAYDGHTAMAIGGFHYLNDNLLLNAGVAWGNTNDVAYRMGVTFSW